MVLKISVEADNMDSLTAIKSLVDMLYSGLFNWTGEFDIKLNLHTVKIKSELPSPCQKK